MPLCYTIFWTTGYAGVGCKHRRLGGWRHRSFKVRGRPGRTATTLTFTAVGAALVGGIGRLGGTVICCGGIGSSGGGAASLPNTPHPRDPNFRRLTVDQIKARHLKGGTELPGSIGNERELDIR